MTKGGKRTGAGRKATGRKANIAKLIYFTTEDIENINIIKDYCKNHVSHKVKNDSQAIRYALNYTALELLLRKGFQD